MDSNYKYHEVNGLKFKITLLTAKEIFVGLELPRTVGARQCNANIQGLQQTRTRMVSSLVMQPNVANLIIRYYYIDTIFTPEHLK